MKGARKIRYAAVAGQFYAGDSVGLASEVRDCYTSRVGPGSVPEPVKGGPRRIRGGVVPHAALLYSGPVAAHFYSAMARDGLPETVIIVGVNHHGTGTGVALTEHDFETPLGLARIDKELAAGFKGTIVENDITAHRYEHSLEVQLPFLLSLNKDIKILPIVMRNMDPKTAQETGRAIEKASQGRDVVIIASTDFSHYVSQATAARQDKLAIDKILSLDAKGLLGVVRKHKISMCGYGPTMAMLHAMGKDSKPRLLKYATSGDITPMPDVVGYASIVIEGGR